MKKQLIPKQGNKVNALDILYRMTNNYYIG